MPAEKIRAEIIARSKEIIAERVKGMALIGEAKERIWGTLGGLTETVKAGNTLEEAVHWAFSRAAREMWSCFLRHVRALICSKIIRNGESASRPS